MCCAFIIIIILVFDFVKVTVYTTIKFRKSYIGMIIKFRTLHTGICQLYLDTVFYLFMSIVTASKRHIVCG